MITITDYEMITITDYEMITITDYEMITITDYEMILYNTLVKLKKNMWMKKYLKYFFDVLIIINMNINVLY